MKFTAMQENLRQILLERIRTRELTGRRLSQQTGFRTAHVSNFLNRKRGLSLEGMDKVLRVQKLSIFDLLDPKEINQHANLAPRRADGFQLVPMVAGSDAGDPRIAKRNVKRALPFSTSFLNRLRPGMEGDRKNWERFLLIRVEQSTGKSMFPKLEPGFVVLIDRHYNSLRRYRKGQPNLYAVYCDGFCVIRYVEKDDGRVLFRPLNATYPISVGNSGESKNRVIGRVCYLGNEV